MGGVGISIGGVIGYAQHFDIFLAEMSLSRFGGLSEISRGLLLACTFCTKPLDRKKLIL